MVGSIAGSSVCVVKGQGIEQEAAFGALPRPPGADSPYSRTCCGSVMDCAAHGGIDEHGTKFGCEAVGGCGSDIDCTAGGGTDEHDTKSGCCESDGEDRRKVGVAGGCRAAADSDGVANGDVRPLTQFAMPVFPTVLGGFVKARITAIEEVVGNILPRLPEADRPNSRTGCGSDSGGTDEHDTKFGC